MLNECEHMCLTNEIDGSYDMTAANTCYGTAGVYQQVHTSMYYVYDIRTSSGFCRCLIGAMQVSWGVIHVSTSYIYIYVSDRCSLFVSLCDFRCRVIALCETRVCVFLQVGVYCLCAFLNGYYAIALILHASMCVS